ncbi:glycosyltransferase [Haliea sp. E17]|uniref:glycosyltransferase n=1 Tax=Haliea sp. E17 TaxID=3401576 RepID=UPI003AACB3CB
MRLLVLTSTFPRWPDDTEPAFVQNLCNYLAENNTIDVVTPHFAGAKVREQMGPLEVYRYRYFPQQWERLAYEGGILPNLRRQPLLALLIPFFLASQLWLVCRLLRRNDYDVIHAHWVIPQAFVALLARALVRRKTPLVVTSHGGDLFALKGPVFSRLKHLIVRHAQHLTVVSSAMRDKAIGLGVPAGKVSVIPMGVDAQNTFVPPPRGARREGLIFVGRLVDKKGVEYLLQAMPAVRQQHSDARLDIIGDGPLRGELEQLVHRLGLQATVHFLGSIPNTAIPAKLQEARIAVVPSVVTDNGDQEGAPVAVMEVMACECTTIVSDYPGARDLIEDGCNGRLVPQRDPQSLALAINSLLADADTCLALGQEGRKTVQQDFDWRVVSARFQAVFDEYASPRSADA